MKYRRLKISFHILRQWLGQAAEHKYQVVEGIPVDAKLVNARHAWPSELELLLESESFDIVPEGEVIPELVLTVREFPFAEPEKVSA